MTYKKPIFLSNLVLTIGFITCFISSAVSQDVFVDIGSAEGAPGSKNNKVEISLANPDNKVKGVQVQICDEENFLSATGCETIGRASGFDCSAYENKKTGCANIVLFSMDPLIVEGEGPVAAVSFDVSDNATLGECVSLTANFGPDPEIGRSAGAIADENNQPLEVEADPGEFCFKTPCVISRILGDDNNSSNLLREFKKEVLLKSKAGEKLVGFYYQHSSEVLEIAVKHPEIKTHIKKVLIGMLPAVKQITDKGNITINTCKMKEISRLCDMLSEKAGTQLKQDIQKLQNDLNKEEIFSKLGIKTN